MCDECKCHENGIGLFSKIHSNLYAELEGRKVIIPDDDNLKEKKKKYEENPSFENLLALAGAYVFQLRYRESLPLYDKCVEMNPCYLARRKRAIIYLKLLDFKKAEEEFSWCLSHGEDKLDVTYRLGLLRYYQKDYMGAMDYFRQCFPMSEDNPDMYVSSLFWFYLSTVRSGCDFREFEGYRKAYMNNFFTHPGYDLFIRFACGEVTEDDAEYEADMLSSLQQSCFCYGMSVYYEKTNERFSKRYRHLCLSNEDYFGGFAYIACYNDENR